MFWMCLHMFSMFRFMSWMWLHLWILVTFASVEHWICRIQISNISRPFHAQAFRISLWSSVRLPVPFCTLWYARQLHYVCIVSRSLLTLTKCACLHLIVIYMCTILLLALQMCMSACTPFNFGCYEVVNKKKFTVTITLLNECFQCSTGDTLACSTS